MAERRPGQEAEAERERHWHRAVELYPDDDGSWVLRGRLDPEVGAALAIALDAGAKELHGTSTEASPAQKRADAPGLLAEMRLADVPAGTSSGRREVVLHVQAEDGHGVLEESGWRVPAKTSRRIACDSGLVVMREDGEGRTLDVGRQKRTVPSAIRRALEKRDRGCCFPGCGLRRTDAHHVRHWADGGRTKLDNLVLLCRRHHRLVHEEGWSVELGADRAVTFFRPNGRGLAVAPPLPAAPADAVAARERTHAAAGITIDEQTPTPDWHGARLDLDWALAAVWRPAERGAAA